MAMTSFSFTMLEQSRGFQGSINRSRELEIVGAMGWLLVFGILKQDCEESFVYTPLCISERNNGLLPITLNHGRYRICEARSQDCLSQLGSTIITALERYKRHYLSHRLWHRSILENGNEMMEGLWCAMNSSGG